jgi:N-acetylglutamate synthase
MNCRIRAMRTTDYDAVISLWRSVTGVGLNENDTRAGIRRYLGRNRGLSFVVCVKGKLAGAVLCGHDGRRGYLHHLAVSPSYRNSGIGKALVERCLASLAKQGIAKCSIFLFRDNENGGKFWKHIGWRLREDICILQKETPLRQGTGAPQGRRHKKKRTP